MCVCVCVVGERDDGARESQRKPGGELLLPGGKLLGGRGG